MTTMRARILHAYCVELGEVVTIDTARKNFVCEEPPKDDYHFFCDDEHCWDNDVRISGVNFRTLASEAPKLRTAHFRHWDAHHPQCKWSVPDDSDVRRPNESEEDAKQRQLRKKLHDLVTVFDPSLDNDEDQGKPPTRAPTPDGSSDDLVTRPKRERPRRDHVEGGHTRTNQLSRLVDTFMEAKEKLSWNEFSQLTLKVVHEGTVSLSDYFCHIRSATFETRNRVIYGGTKFIKKYGTGFKLRFFDKVAGTDVLLYVSKEQMAKYRFRKLIEQAIDNVDQVKYITAYAIGHLRPGQTDGFSDLIVDDLKHLVLVPGPLKSAGDAQSPPEANKTD